MSDGDGKFNYQDSVSLKEYFDSRFDAMDKALRLATDALNARLESMNEFREALRDQASRMVTRAECSVLHNRSTDDIRGLQKFQSTLEGKASQNAVILAILISTVSAGVAIAGLVMK